MNVVMLAEYKEFVSSYVRVILSKGHLSGDLESIAHVSCVTVGHRYGWLSGDSCVSMNDGSLNRQAV